MSTDRELLQAYARDASEAAFAEIVRRHVNLVYGTALRQLCGNETLARDVTQAVFTALARPAGGGARIAHLSAWLYTTTRFTVAHTVRAERRRQDREHQAYTMHALLTDSGEDPPPAIPPELLDRALEHLDDPERDAILLRFFEGQSFAVIGGTLAVSEDAARMRVTRALERIRRLFAKNGVTSSAAALAAALSQQAIAAPATLAASVSNAALAGTAGLGAAAGAKLGILTFMTTTKTLTFAASAVAVAALGYVGYQQHETQLLRQQVAALVADGQRAQAETQQALQRAQAAELRAGQSAERLAALQQTVAHAATAAAKTPAALPASRTLAPKDSAALAEKKRRMAEMKPLLEAGRPIKGAVIVLVDGKPVQRAVAFVMGQETRVDGIDDGSYSFTPTLKPDGSVQYAVKLTRSGAASEEQRLPTVIQTPWEGFTLSAGGGKVIAFDPDPGTP